MKPRRPGNTRENHAIRHACYWCACGGGISLLPYANKAPGTFGSLLAVALYIPLKDLPIGLYLILCLLLFFGATWCVRVCLPAFASDNQSDSHDPGAIVIDEVAGALLAFTALPSGWLWLCAAFVLFRVFDIWKPWPIGWVDRHIKGATGIMLDDALAGLFVIITIQIAALAWSILPLAQSMP